MSIGTTEPTGCNLVPAKAYAATGDKIESTLQEPQRQAMQKDHDEECQDDVSNAGRWGNYVAVGIIAVAIVCCILMTRTTNPPVVAVLFASLAVLVEFLVGYPLHRRCGWKGNGRIKPPCKDNTFALGISRIAKASDWAQGSAPVTIGGVLRESGYQGELFEKFLKPKHLLGAFQGEPGQDLRYGFRRVCTVALLAMAFSALCLFLFTIPTMGVTVNWSGCTDPECKLRTFEEQIFQGASCQTRSTNEDDKRYDRSGMEQMIPFNIYHASAKTSSWLFVNVGTLMNTMVFLNFANPNSMKVMWATSLSATAVYALVYWLPFSFDTTSNLPQLVYAFTHALHCLLLELCSEPKRFGRFKCPNSMAFLTGFFVHFLAGIIMIVVLTGVDRTIGFVSIPSSMITVVVSLMISAGETLLQFVFARLYEVPIAAAALYVSAFQLPLYGRRRGFFATLSTRELVTCSLTNMFMKIGLRFVMLPVNSFFWNNDLKKNGPHKGMSQRLSIYVSNLISGMAAEHVAIFLSVLMTAIANPVAWNTSQAPTMDVNGTDLLLNYLVQFSIELLTDTIVLVMLVGFMRLNIKYLFDTCHDRLFYIGFMMVLAVTVSLSLSNALVGSCWLCEYKEQCLSYIRNGELSSEDPFR